MGELHRGDRQRPTVLAAALEPLAVPPLHIERREIGQPLRAEVRLDVATDDLAVVRPRHGAQLGLGSLVPLVEELAQGRPRRRHVHAALGAGEGTVERRLRVLLGPETTHLALAATATIVEAGIDPVAPRAACGARFAHGPFMR